MPGQIGADSPDVFVQNPASRSAQSGNHDKLPCAVDLARPAARGPKSPEVSEDEVASSSMTVCRPTIFELQQPHIAPLDTYPPRRSAALPSYPPRSSSRTA